MSLVAISLQNPVLLILFSGESYLFRSGFRAIDLFLAQDKIEIKKKKAFQFDCCLKNKTKQNNYKCSLSLCFVFETMSVAHAGVQWHDHG